LAIAIEVSESQVTYRLFWILVKLDHCIWSCGDIAIIQKCGSDSLSKLQNIKTMQITKATIRSSRFLFSYLKSSSLWDDGGDQAVQDTTKAKLAKEALNRIQQRAGNGCN
jgi:hypothetical protein